MVLHCRNSLEKQHTFNTNRGVEVPELIFVDQWFCTANFITAAGVATRSFSADVLKFSSWFNGRDFIRKPNVVSAVDNPVVVSTKLRKFEQQVFVRVAYWQEMCQLFFDRW